MTGDSPKSRINIITLGCSKNLVDSEIIIKQLETNGCYVVHEQDFQKDDIIIINTCGFISDAKQESIDTILQYVKLKENGKIGSLCVTGCLSERYRNELIEEIPEADGYFGTNDLPELLKALGTEYKKHVAGERILTTPDHYAYLKISEGCDRTCAFCAIPLMRGKHISRTGEDIIHEAQKLSEKGVKEIMLIAQDLSYYGLDLYKETRLALLLEGLSSVKNIEWIRLHYAFPSKFPVEILKLIKEKNNICKYIDIPLQHISDNMLNRMKRGIDRKQTIKLLELIRKEVPGIAIRTSLMTGHPGETDNDFKELKQFVTDMEFDRLGVFTYSHEEDTYSYKHYKDDIPEKVKTARMEELMEVQQVISGKLNNRKIGKLFKVIIDRKEGEYFIGRTEFDSPEVDNEVLVQGDNISIGQFYDVKITSTDEYDLYGEIENSQQ